MTIAVKHDFLRFVVQFFWAALADHSKLYYSDLLLPSLM
jgi:hypothetical protein